MNLTKVQVIQDLIILQDKLDNEISLVIKDNTKITGLLEVYKGIGTLIDKLEISRLEDSNK